MTSKDGNKQAFNSALPVLAKAAAPKFLGRLSQDPHAVRESLPEQLLETAIGHEVRGIRKMLGLRAADLAKATSVSAGMISKIENGLISPSLTTLQALSRALGVPVSTFFRRFEEPRNAMFMKASRCIDVEHCGTTVRSQRKLLGCIGIDTSDVKVSPFLVIVAKKSDIFPVFHHCGTEFIYMLEGEIVYRHVNNLYHITQGDSLLFDADAPHGPEEIVSLPIKFLSIVVISRSREG